MNKYLLLRRVLLLSVLMPGIALSQELQKTQVVPWMDIRRSASYSPSAQTWDFVRFGNTPVDLYSGTARADIPIYTYSDADFTIPVSLGYASGGFMPAQQTGIVGLNWFLNAGGVITREIRGIDDLNGDSPQDHTRGFINSGLKFSDTQVLTQTGFVKVGSDLTYHNVSSSKSETQSDIYRFNFMGHSGTFHYDGQRQCCVYDTGGNNGCYKIAYELGSRAEFTITTDDGFIYTFGSLHSDEYAERSLEGGFKEENLVYYFNRDGSNSQVSWMLRQIKAPNGRCVTFTYEHGELTTYQYIKDGETLCDNYIVTYSPDMYDLVYPTYYKRPHVLKTTYLASIDIDSKVLISFGYSSKAGPEVLSNNSQSGRAYGKIVSTLRQLDKIEVRDVKRNTTLGGCTLSYRTVDRRPLLNVVSVRGLGNYRMVYYENGSFPDLLSNGVDFWGFANGRTQSDDTALAGTKTDESWNEYAAAESCKLPNTTASLRGNLKKLTYPTGGWTEFEYEGHEVEFAVLRRVSKGGGGEEEVIGPPAEWTEEPTNPPLAGEESTTAFMPSLYNFRVLQIPGKHAGGVRIRRITDDDGQGCRTTRTFDYTNAVTGASTGNLLRFPRLIAYTFVSPVGREANAYMLHLNSARNSFDKSHVEYSQVTETLSDGSKVVYNYSNYRNMPDDFSGQSPYLHGLNPDGLGPEKFLLNSILRDPNSRHSRRGKLRSQFSYDATGRQVRREEFTYENHNKNAAVDYSAYAVSSGEYIWAAKLYTGDVRLTRKLTVDSLPSGARVVDTRYGFNTLGQSALTTTLDGADTLSEQIRYIPDILAAQRTPAEQAMFDSHRYAPVEHRQLRRVDRVDKTVALSRCAYELFLDKPRLHTTQTAHISSPQTSDVNLKFRTDLSYNAYDSKGNVVQTTDRAGLKTCYVWGYDGLCLLARVENAAIGALDDMGLPGSGDDPLAGSLPPDMEQRLRALPGALVTTYDHIPYVGLSRVTDPAGRTTTYQYDEFGRLEKSVDMDSNPVTGFYYNIPNNFNYETPNFDRPFFD